MEFGVRGSSFVSWMFPANCSNNDTFAAVSFPYFAAVTDFPYTAFFLRCIAMYVA